MGDVGLEVVAESRASEAFVEGGFDVADAGAGEEGRVDVVAEGEGDAGGGLGGGDLDGHGGQGVLDGWVDGLFERLSFLVGASGVPVEMGVMTRMDKC